MFKFEKQYWDKEGVSCEFVGHPLLENDSKSKIDINQLIGRNKAIISLFSGSRESEVNTLTPILFDFIKIMNKRYEDFLYVFHTTKSQRVSIEKHLNTSNLKNVEVISDEKIKNHILRKSIFAVAKSGTISLEICNQKIPSIIIYKMNFINFLIVKFLVKTKFANIINIINQKEVIPELIQKECNAKEIFRSVVYFLKNPDLMKKQINEVNNTLDEIKSKTSSSMEASLILQKYLS